MGVLNKEALSVNSPDRLVREAFLMTYDYIDKPLLTPFPIFQDVTENTACLILICILDEHFLPPTPGTKRRDLAWSTVLSTVLSVHVLAGQMAIHCHDSGDGDGTARGMFECGFVYHFLEKQDLVCQLDKVPPTFCGRECLSQHRPLLT
uniref:Uncharacterized protein n=1 Tax=Pundamilia nyererei TaxID=303518 RepID=A0A3B4FCZ4_9CICH